MERRANDRIALRMKSAALALTLLVAGCAQFVGGPCDRDWYELRQHDGRIGTTRQGDLYAAACSSFDTARFQQGWAEGYAHRN